MPYLTLDELMARLQSCKDAGVPGNIPMAMPAAAHCGGGMLQRIENIHQLAVGKSDMDRGHALCRAVATRGVPVLVLQ